ncbi:MAG: sel1 repeat family protein [Burkholderiales bacterium]|nr:sel1 repeat family protein [Burkholderiales bacterium]
MTPKRRIASAAAAAWLAAAPAAPASELLAPEAATAQAEQLIAAGDVEAAVPLLERAGRNWYPDADVLLGQLYLDGQGIERDPRRAADVLERAASPNWMRALHKRGHPEAQHALATLHASGDVGDIDLRAAFRLHLAAARAGHAGSQLALARMYAAGEGVRSDPAEAYRWARIAAMSGDAAVRDEADPLADALRGQIALGLAERLDREAARFQPEAG